MNLAMLDHSFTETSQMNKNRDIDLHAGESVLY